MRWTPDVTWQASSLADDTEIEWMALDKKDRKRLKKAAKRARKRAAWQQTLPSFERTTASHRREAQVRLEGLPETPGLRVIFTDFDGVLNQHSSGSYLLKREQVERLDRLARETGAVVVVSSWWRWIGVERLREDLASAGFHGRLIGRTPWLGESEQWDAYERGTEIDAVLRYLADKVESFVILDDHNRMGNLLPYLVQTVASEGLTEADCEMAKCVLLNPVPRQPFASGVYELVDA
jgi:Swiss Army Knife RNA repair-like protein